MHTKNAESHYGITQTASNKITQKIIAAVHPKVPAIKTIGIHIKGESIKAVNCIFGLYGG